MNPVIKNILVVVVGILCGSVANAALLELGGHIISPPAGADMSTSEGLSAAMNLMQPKHFLFPFLAHAFGTLTGAYIVARFAAARPMQLTMIIPSAFFMGGLIMILMLPSPVWFNVTDLVLAYFPMGLLGYKWGRR